ncbi:uncharacterized protein LOC128878291 [Hylaeus volcanicus]|uniref:uncharacterized protein LOC128878291 n=1 Tax=Hylaeus volcanicus TaxID=313075 RepID=UPI0023B81D0E|nr:uncharacterized protein LOC128878291 [Hylaeus volcanicus]
MDKFKMKDDKYTRPEHQEILDEFTRVRDAYVALKTYCDSQEETVKIENERLERMKGNLERLSKVCLLLENRYKLIAEEMQTENATLRKTVQDLKEQCNHLRLIVADRNGDYEQTVRLQDEVEVLKGQLLLQQEKYREDVASLIHRHSDEIQKYKVLLMNAKQNAVSVTFNLLINIDNSIEYDG